MAALTFFLKLRMKSRPLFPTTIKEGNRIVFSISHSWPARVFLSLKADLWVLIWEDVPTSYVGNKEKFSVANVVRNIT